jgi:hypothetical protein
MRRTGRDLLRSCPFSPSDRIVPPATTTRPAIAAGGSPPTRRRLTFGAHRLMYSAGSRPPDQALHPVAADGGRWGECGVRRASRRRRGADRAAGEARVKGRRHGSGVDLRRPFTTTRSGSACALVTLLDEGVTVRAHPPLRPDRAGRGPAAPTPCRRVESLRGAQRRRLLCSPISRLLAHLPPPVLTCSAAAARLSSRPRGALPSRSRSAPIARHQ